MNGDSALGSGSFLKLTAKSMIHYFSGMGLSEFIHHNYYFRINVTENTVLEHTSALIDFTYYPDNYDEFLEQFSENIFPSSNTEKIVFSLNRNMILNHYEKGEDFWSCDYLLCNQANVTRQFTAFCQLSPENSCVIALVLIVDTSWLNNSSSIGRAYSEFDWVTGMYQRAYGARICSEWIRYHSGDYAVVAMLSLNDYDRLHEEGGVDVVNDIIRDIHTKLKNIFVNNCIISRFAENEFCIFIINSTPDRAMELLDEFALSRLSLPAKGGTVSCTVHIGYALYPRNSQDFAELCFFAETALSQAKAPERSQVVRFSREMLTEGSARNGFTLKELSDSIPVPFFVVRPAKEGGEILYADRELIRCFECDSLEDFLLFTGRNPERCIYEEDREKLSALLSEGSGSASLRFIARDGVLKEYRATLYPSESTYCGKLYYLLLS